MEESKRRKEDDGFTSSSMDMDRVSDLPQPILHHILSFLPQNQAAQTCLLSKSWCNVWCTRPNIEFCQPRFFGYMKRFLSSIDQTLQRYHRQNLSIKRFVVKMTSRVDSESTLLLERWIPIALMNLGVEKFHLTFPPHPLYSGYYYALPSAPAVFQAEFLTELYLSGFQISSTYYKQLCLNHLKTLSLNNVYTEDKTLAKIMASCPLIERVDLNRCKGLTTVNVNNLTHFDCMSSGRYLKIKVPSPLETIKISYCLSLCLYNSSNHHFPRLKSLYLFDVELPKGFFDSFSCNYPCLEHLELRFCSGIKEVKILSCSVKRLIIVEMEYQIKTITIDAPHIIYFQLSCRPVAWSITLPSVSFAPVASKEWESNISVPFLLDRSSIDISPLFLKLNEVFKALRQSRITLNLYYMRNHHIKDISYAGCYEPLALEHLNLRGFDSYDDDFDALFNCLFRIFHPKYLYTRMHSNPRNMPYLEIDKLAEFILKTKLAEFIWKTKLVEFIWKANLKDGDFSQCYFWQQMKELSVEILEHDSRQWRLVQGSSLTICALKEIQEMKTVRFAFEWRERVLLA